MLFSYFLGGFKNTFTKVSKSTEVQKKDNSKTEKSEPTAGEFKLVCFDCELVSQSYKPLFWGKVVTSLPPLMSSSFLDQTPPPPPPLKW